MQFLQKIAYENMTLEYLNTVFWYFKQIIFDTSLIVHYKKDRLTTNITNLHFRSMLQTTEFFYTVSIKIPTEK